METGDDNEQPIRFRSSKKRKTYRHRDSDSRANNHNDDGSSQQQQHHNTAAPAPSSIYYTSPSTAAPGDDMVESDNRHDAEEDDRSHNPHPSVTAAIRARKFRSRAHLGGGVGFRSVPAANSNETPQSLILHRDARPSSASGAVEGTGPDGDGGETPAVVDITSRFTHQTGLMPELDDIHMNEYVESRLKSRRRAQQTEQEEVNNAAGSQAATATGPATVSAGAAAALGKTPADGHATSSAYGKLVEVDLSTQLASAYRGRKVDASSATSGTGKKKQEQRLGKDGKPWRGGRNRRGSDDVARDRLVEQLLHENKLDVYGDAPQATSTKREEDLDGDADERLAEQFRRQYMDEVAQRRQKKRKPTTQQPAKGSEDVLRGPKLGGSRNVRSQVRDALLKQEKAANKR